MGAEIVYLSLGSNIGDRESNLAQATMALSLNINISAANLHFYWYLRIAN